MLESELCRALRAAVLATTVGAADYQATWDGNQYPESTGTVTHLWPNPGKELKKKSTSNTGNIPTTSPTILS